MVEQMLMASDDRVLGDRGIAVRLGGRTHGGRHSRSGGPRDRCVSGEMLHIGKALGSDDPEEVELCTTNGLAAMAVDHNRRPDSRQEADMPPDGFRWTPTCKRE